MKIIIYGIYGKMGVEVLRAAQAGGIEIACGIDKTAGAASGVPVYCSLSDFKGKADVLIDFSRPDALDGILQYAQRTGTAAVLCTTGYNEQQLKQIEDASRTVPLLRSSNMSLGINLVSKLIADAHKVLGNNYDIEIIEKHHNQKVDAPSGTAIMLADSINAAANKKYIYGREGHTGKRGDEIAIHAVRGGTIVGEHEVIFAGNDEIITISHTALSRKILADGAIAAARFLLSRPAALYSMQQVVNA